MRAKYPRAMADVTVSAELHVARDDAVRIYAAVGSNDDRSDNDGRGMDSH